MPDPKDFDLDFRPDSYWDKRDNPMFMGGEYLPDQYPNEVEIARVTMKSTTMDVISIRARRTTQRIFYRIVDEYYDENDGKGMFQYHLLQKTSTRPLTMRQLISVIDNAQENGGLIGHARQMNYKETADDEELFNFATISSEFYPELSTWYDQANEEWLDARLYEETGQTKAERLEEKFRDRYLKRERAVNAQEKEWRRKNKNELQAERREIELSQLHYEYEKRFKAQKDPQSEKEIAWRVQNENRLKKEMQFETAVASCMDTAEWLFGPGMGGAWGYAIYRSSIRRFIENYFKCNGYLPSGEHTVKVSGAANSFDIKVKFKPRDTNKKATKNSNEPSL